MLTDQFLPDFYSIIPNAVKQALVDTDLRPHEVILVSGIGQAAKLPHYLRCNFFNELHGRALPVATAIRIANSDLPVIVIGGDGDTCGEGGTISFTNFGEISI